MSFFDWFTKDAGPESQKGSITHPIDLAALEAYMTGGTSSGVNVSPETAMRVIAVFSCVSVLSRSVAQTPMHLFELGEDGTKTKDIKHPVAVVMNRRPNRWQTPFEFKQLLQTHLCLRGNGLAHIIRVGGNVRALIPLHPDRVSAAQRDDMSIEYKVAVKGGSPVIVPQKDMLHIRGLSANGVTGLSPITQAREAIGLSLQTEQHGARLFSNGAQIGGLLEHPGTMSEEAANRLTAKFDSKYAGVENSHKTILLEEGMKYAKVSMTAEDAQFLETRKFQRSEIAALFGVPPHMIGDLDKATFSNIEHQGLQFVRHSLAGWFACWAQAFERDLLTDEEIIRYEAAFDPRELTQGDFKSRMEGYSIGVQSGVFSPNDARRLEGENPRDGGDVYLTPMNMNTTGGNDADQDKPNSDKA